MKYLTLIVLFLLTSCGLSEKDEEFFELVDKHCSKSFEVSGDKSEEIIKIQNEYYRDYGHDALLKCGKLSIGVKYTSDNEYGSSRFSSYDYTITVYVLEQEFPINDFEVSSIKDKIFDNIPKYNSLRNERIRTKLLESI